MDGFYIFLTVAVLSTGLEAVQWTDGPEEGEVITVCRGMNVSLPWRVQPGPGDVIKDIEWFYLGQSEEVIAALIHGHFVTYPAFVGRVSHTENAGIVLDGLLPADAGNYSVRVTGRDADGNIYEVYRSVIVHVSDHLVTHDGYLHAAQSLDLVQDSTTGNWTVHLLCGVFSFLEKQPYFVEWTIPGGDVRNSSSYHNGYFHLALSAPVASGLYSCRVPGQYLNDSCILGEGSTHVEASTMVDGVVASFALMEKEIEQLSSENRNLSAHIVRLEQELNDTTTCLVNRHTGPCHPDNYTIIDDPRRMPEKPSSSLCDASLQPGWYRFLLQDSNAVIPTTCVPESHCHTVATTWLDLQGQSLPAEGQEVQARACSNYVSSCCHWEAPITVRNCSDFLVYKLQPSDKCDLAYCVETQA